MGEYAERERRPAPADQAVSTAPAGTQAEDRVEGYLEQFSAQLWHALRSYLDKVDLAVPSPKLAWTDEAKFLDATFKYLRPFVVFVARDKLTKLLFPQMRTESWW